LRERLDRNALKPDRDSCPSYRCDLNELEYLQLPRARFEFPDKRIRTFQLRGLRRDLPLSKARTRDHLAIEHRHHHFDVLDLIGCHGEWVC
jgi:hypothetical protein